MGPRGGIPTYNIKLNKEYVGIVLPDKDPKNRGRYKVYIPELMPHLKKKQGIWCVNHVHKWRVNRDSCADVGSYGQYYPLHPDTVVIVKFHDPEDLNSGYIDRIVYDYEKDFVLDPPWCECPPLDKNDRDEIYVFFKTPKFDNVFFVREETSNDRDSMWLVYGRGFSYIKWNREGVRIWTRGHLGIFACETIWIRARRWIELRSDEDKIYIFSPNKVGGGIYIGACLTVQIVSYKQNVELYAKEQSILLRSKQNMYLLSEQANIYLDTPNGIIHENKPQQHPPIIPWEAPISKLEPIRPKPGSKGEPGIVGGRLNITPGYGKEPVCLTRKYSLFGEDEKDAPCQGRSQRDRIGPLKNCASICKEQPPGLCNTDNSGITI